MFKNAIAFNQSLKSWNVKHIKSTSMKLNVFDGTISLDEKFKKEMKSKGWK
jgi:hypothetical protein